jgi:hypothetical protein
VGSAAPATPGFWFDCDVKVTAASARAARAAGARGIIRYLGLGDGNGPGDLDPEETSAINGEGLEILAVQHAFEPETFDPAPGTGTVYGSRAAKNADRAGLVQGMTIYGDAEGSKLSIPESSWLAYWNDWADSVFARSDSGLYVGYQSGMTSAGLYSLRRIDTYFSDAGRRKVDVRGCALHQLGPSIVSKLLGLGMDIDWLEPDALGGLPVSMHP